MITSTFADYQWGDLWLWFSICPRCYGEFGSQNLQSI